MNCLVTSERVSLNPLVAGLSYILQDQILLIHPVSFLHCLPFLLSVLTGLILGCLVVGSWQNGVASAWLRMDLPGTPLPAAQLKVKGCLKASAEVFIKESVDDGVDAAVEKGQPVSKGVDVDVDDLQLDVRKAGVVCEHHQAPQGKPGQGEKQSHNNEHFDDFLFLLGDAVPLLPPVLSHRRRRCVGESDAYPGVHDNNERQGSQVDVGKQNCCVNLSHSRVRPVLPAPVYGAGLVAVAKDHPEMLLLLYLQHDCRRTHDCDGQNPDDGDNGDCGRNCQLLLKWVHDAPKPAAKTPRTYVERPSKGG